MTFNPDGTYSATAADSTSSTLFTASPTCLGPSGIGQTCDQIANRDDAGLSCADTTSGCQCQATHPYVDPSAKGTYVTDGQTVTLTSANVGVTYTQGYCVSGSRLDIVSLPVPPFETSDLVLGRQ